MHSTHSETRQARTSQFPLGRLVRAVATAATLFVIGAITLGTTAAALFWGGISMFGVNGRWSLIAALVGVAATLPAVLWLTVRGYRMEIAGILPERARPGGQADDG